MVGKRNAPWEASEFGETTRGRGDVDWSSVGADTAIDGRRVFTSRNKVERRILRDCRLKSRNPPQFIVDMQT